MARAMAALAAGWCGPGQAHSFGQSYTLPVPVWMYVYGACAALLLSFVVVGYCVTARSSARNRARIDLGERAPFRALLHPRVVGALRILSVAVLAFTLLCAALGSHDAYANFAMTQFWIIFVLGYAYSVALLGNSYAWLNPWLVICLWIERRWPRAFVARAGLGDSLAYWPALLLYIGFIWFELFGRGRPISLAWMLGGYSLLTFAGATWLGRRYWFERAEFFAVLFRLLGKMAPLCVHRHADGSARLQLRQPFAGLNSAPPREISLLVFILFLLASTAYDGLKSTIPFVRIYWEHLPNLLRDLSGAAPGFVTLRAWYPYWQTFSLLLAPLLYLLVYLAFIALCRWAAGSRLSVRQLALHFAYSLLPIALVYHLTHYYSLLLSQGPQILALASDPFGWGWNLFGTLHWRLSVLPQPGTIWHTQLWLILAGHIVSVYLAHSASLQLFGSGRRAMLSQLPMLLLMLFLTGFGLWILSLPLSRGGV